MKFVMTIFFLEIDFLQFSKDLQYSIIYQLYWTNIVETFTSLIKSKGDSAKIVSLKSVQQRLKIEYKIVIQSLVVVSVLAITALATFKREIYTKFYQHALRTSRVTY